jgi:hypothetical protein
MTVDGGRLTMEEGQRSKVESQWSMVDGLSSNCWQLLMPIRHLLIGVTDLE